ncbi:efflux transporter outer membrane subunit [Dyella flava]|uniref:Efflux transporter outer membrane subunit n=2 Tax=Dyella flava TaxID=1920170 RepID=A0ABS2K1C9_9GAMM|nr:efflux transporter outer membrane subunit [Dyella flava]
MLMTAALTACTVGPDYKVPSSAAFNTPAAQGSFVSGNNAALSSDQLPSQWWHMYDDPKLDAYIAQALKANTDLRVAQANLERSYAELKSVRTEKQPSVSFNGQLEYTQESGEQYLQPVRPPVATDYQAGLTVGYDLDLFGGIRRGIEASTADSQAVLAARDLVRVNVVAETTRAYVDACGYGLELQAAKNTLALQQQSLALTSQLMQGGRAMDVDVTRSRQLVDQTRESVPALQAAQRNALYRLATLMGKPPADYAADLEQCTAPPRLTRPLPIGDGTAMLKRRPDIREAERQLAAATANIGVATAALYPDVAIGASAGSAGSAADGFSAPTNFWGLGLVVNWQINRNAARARIGAAQATAKGALANFDGVVLGALQDTESSLNVYTHDLQREASAQASRDDAAQAEQETERLFAGGRATSLELVDAQRTLASAELSLAQVKVAISDDQTNVFLALGGGWENR